MRVVIFLICGLVALWIFEAWLRSRGPSVHPIPQRIPWYHYAIIAVLFTVGPIQTGAFSPFLAAFVACLLGYTAWEFCKQRPQFSIRGILLAMLLVAILCSASRFVPAVYPIGVLLAFLGAWTRYQSRDGLDSVEVSEKG
jgi:hypothetical protein